MEGDEVRVLVAFEEEYRIYQDAIMRTFRLLRPHIEVSVAELGTLEAKVAHLDPHLVICDRPDAVGAADVPAWLVLPTKDYGHSAKLCLGGEYSEVNGLGLDELLRIVDGAERLVRTNPNLGGC
jgi:hypothetical protein